MDDLAFEIMQLKPWQGNECGKFASESIKAFSYYIEWTAGSKDSNDFKHFKHQLKY